MIRYVREALMRAAQMFEDIGKRGHLAEGGEQYPNALNCYDEAARLRSIVRDLGKLRRPIHIWDIKAFFEEVPPDTRNDPAVDWKSVAFGFFLAQGVHSSTLTEEVLNACLCASFEEAKEALQESTGRSTGTIWAGRRNS